MNTRTKSLFHYIFPAVGGLFVTYLYNVVDGIAESMEEHLHWKTDKVMAQRLLLLSK